MPTNVDVTVHEGQPWKIIFTAHNADDSVMVLEGDTDVEFIVSDDEDTDLFTKSVANNGVSITDGANGVAEISISVQDQETYGLTSAKTYFYEIRVVKIDEFSPQAEGKLIIEGSLFSTAVHPLLNQFKLRFTEFTQSDPTISLFLSDAAAVVDADDTWPAAVRDRAVLYLAAHLLLMRKNATSQYTSGGGATGAVRSIRVEDRSVVFDTQSQRSSSNTGLNQSLYGQEYLAMLRRNPRWVKRA